MCFRTVYGLNAKLFVMFAFLLPILVTNLMFIHLSCRQNVVSVALIHRSNVLIFTIGKTNLSTRNNLQQQIKNSFVIGKVSFYPKFSWVKNKNRVPRFSSSDELFAFVIHEISPRKSPGERCWICRNLIAFPTAEFKRFLRKLKKQEQRSSFCVDRAKIRM